MKVIDKITLVIYSYIVLIISVVTGLIILGWLEPSLVEKVVNILLYQDFPSKVVLGLDALFVLLSFKCIFLGDSAGKKKLKEKQGILLQNENGKLMISRETIENISNSIVKKYSSVEESTAKVSVNEANEVSILLSLVVNQNASIKEITIDLQEQIKSAIKGTLDLDVKEVNVRIKNVSTKKDVTKKEIVDVVSVEEVSEKGSNSNE